MNVIPNTMFCINSIILYLRRSAAAAEAYYLKERERERTLIYTHSNRQQIHDTYFLASSIWTLLNSGAQRWFRYSRPNVRDVRIQAWTYAQMYCRGAPVNYCSSYILQGIKWIFLLITQKIILGTIKCMQTHPSCFVEIFSLNCGEWALGKLILDNLKQLRLRNSITNRIWHQNLHIAIKWMGLMKLINKGHPHSVPQWAWGSVAL